MIFEICLFLRTFFIPAEGQVAVSFLGDLLKYSEIYLDLFLAAP